MNEPTGAQKVKFSELSGFFPKQQEALEASKRFKFLLYGGSVGSGKSRWLRWTCIYWLISLYGKTDIRGIRAGLFCEDYPSLNDRHLTKIRYEFPDWLGTYNEAKKEFTLAPEYGSGILAFRNLDDPSKYLSVEFAVEAIDEINRNPVTAFVELRKRLRWPGIKDVKFIAACNPIGEAWVKNFWVKRLYPPEEKEQMEFFYVPALPTDNPHLPVEYFKGLESLPEAQRKAVLEANWDAFDETMDESGYLRLLTDREYSGCIADISEHHGYKVLGVDPAAGGDNSAIVLKSGNLQEVLFNQKLRDVMDLCNVVADFYRTYSAAMIVVDKSGLGEGVYSRLKQMDFPVRGISFGESSEDEMFFNLKAELYWKERQWLLSGGRLRRNTGWNEFETIKYKNRNGQIFIQPKEELFKLGLSSPNCVDAAVLTQYVTDGAIKAQRALKAHNGVFHDGIIDIWRGTK